MASGTVTGSLQQVFQLVAGGAKTPPKLPARQLPDRVLGLGDELRLFVRQLEFVVTNLVRIAGTRPTSAITRLNAVRDDVVEIRDRQYDPALFAAGGVAQLSDRVYYGMEALIIAAPNLVNATQLSLPDQWLTSTQTVLSTEAAKAADLYAKAVANAWLFGWAQTGTLQAADAVLANFPALVRTKYLAFGLDASIAEITSLRNKLSSLVGQNPPATPASYGDVSITAVANGVWLPAQQLTQEVDSARRSVPGAEAKQAKAIVDAITHKIQAYHLTMLGLLIERQIQMLWDKFPFDTAKKTALQPDKDAVLDALDKIHSQFAAGGDTYRQGATALVAVVNGAGFKQRFDDAVDQLELIDTVKTVVIMAAIAAVAAETGGVAAVAAEAAISEAAAGAVLLETGTWAGIGAFAAEVMTFTLVNRLGERLLLGQQATDETSFVDDLVMNAVTMGLLKVVAAGYGAVFRNANAKGWRFRLGKFAVEQISLFAFNETLSVIRAGGWEGLAKTDRALIQQIGMTAVMVLAAKVSKSVRQRFGGVAGAVDTNALDALEFTAHDIDDMLAKMKAGTATESEQTQFPDKVNDQINKEAALAKTAPDGTPGKEELLKAYTEMKQTTELQLAIAGQETSMSGPDAPSTFAPGGPGVVVYDSAATDVVEKVSAQKGAPSLDPSPVIEGAKEAAPPDGPPITYVDMKAAKKPPPTPQQMEQAALVTDAIGKDADGNDLTIGAIIDGADTGEQNLRSRYKDTDVRTIKAMVDPKLLPEFLRFLGHPDFADPNKPFLFEDFKAFASSEEARDLASQIGPELVKKIHQKLTLDPSARSTFSKYELDVLRFAAKELAAQPTPAARAYEAEQMADFTRGDWTVEMNGPPPAKPKPKAPTLQDLGVGPAYQKWQAIRALLAETYGTTLTEQQLNDRADVEHILAKARAGGPGGFGEMSLADRIEVIRDFNKRCQKAGLNYRQTSGKLGALAEWLMLPNAKKTIWYGRKPSPPGEQTSKPDDYQIVNGRKIATELKANRFYEMGTNGDGTGPTAESAARAIAEQHALDINGEFDAGGNLVDTGDWHNLELGTEFEIWYVFEPSPAQKQAMLEVFRRPGSRIQRVRFGLLAPEVIAPVAP